jgi:hypothetical protein
MYYRSPPIITSIWRADERPYRPRYRGSHLHYSPQEYSTLFRLDLRMKMEPKASSGGLLPQSPSTNGFRVLLKKFHVTLDLVAARSYKKGRRFLIAALDSVASDTSLVPRKSSAQTLPAQLVPSQSRLRRASVCARLETRSSHLAFTGHFSSVRFYSLCLRQPKSALLPCTECIRGLD